MPSEEQILAFPEILANEPSNRSAAIMAAALVEQALYTAITCRLVDPGESILKAWFEGENAPFGTFSAKIKLGRALGIYREKMEGRLVIIKNVRNVFAHRSTPITFGHPSIKQEIEKLRTRKTHEGAAAYYSMCLALSKLLIQDGFKHGGKDVPVSFP